MVEKRIVLITGAAGNLGGKLRRHLEERYPLRLLDREPRGDSAIVAADLSQWGGWTEQFRGVDTVFHLAADPTAQQSWPKLIAPNIDATIHVFHAAVQAAVRRIVYASSNHVMGDIQGSRTVSHHHGLAAHARHTLRGRRRGARQRPLCGDQAIR